MKTCLITGTTHGIGAVTAMAIAKHGCRTVMACRDLQRAEELRRRIVEATGNDHVHVLHCDLSSQQSVRDAADEFLDRHTGLHLLVNNAGMMTGQPELSIDGIEMMFATNHLGPFLLTRLLLQRIRQSAPARIVNVASSYHHRGKLNLDDVRTMRSFAPLQTYSRSKLSNVLFTLALARRLDGDDVTVNCLHPGAVGSNIIPTNKLWLRWGGPIAKRFMLSETRGAQTSIYLALSDDVVGVTGAYFDERQTIRTPSDLARDSVEQERLWQFSSELCGLPPSF